VIKVVETLDEVEDILDEVKEQFVSTGSRLGCDYACQH
jgi:hypothetical protein